MEIENESSLSLSLHSGVSESEDETRENENFGIGFLRKVVESTCFLYRTYESTISPSYIHRIDAGRANPRRQVV